MRLSVLLVFAAVLVGASPPAGAPAWVAGATRVVPALADPAAEPGIGRCTSDGACTVTDASGTRPAAPLRLAP